MEFAYEATDADGSLIEGSLTADTAESALEQIREAGYVPLRLVPDLPEEAVEPRPKRPKRGPKEKAPTNGPAEEAPAEDQVEADEEAPVPAIGKAARTDLSPQVPSALEPMPAPRQLYIGPMYVFTEPLAKFGLYFGIIALAVTFVFLIVNPVTALFPMAFLAIAVGVGSAGWNAGRKRLRAWRYGKPAPAEIIWIGQDTSYRVNGKSPWMMRYQFSVGTETVTGTRKSFNESITNLRLHEKIWVVYLPENPAISAEWPPIP